MSNFQDFYLPGQDDQATVLLMHSLSDSSEIMKPLAEELNQAGYSVFYPTYESHQNNDLEEIMAADFLSYQVDAENYYSWLKEQGHEDIVAAGMSIGGLLSFDLTTKFSDVKAVVSISTPIFTDLTLTKVPYIIRQRYYSTFDSTPTKEERSQAQDLFDQFKENLRTINHWAEGSFSEIRQLTLPVFIAQAENDELIKSDISGRLKRVLSESSHVDLNIYEEGQHYLTKEPTIESLSRDIVNFLDSL